MNKEVIIIIIGWLITITLLILFVPKDKIRHAQVIFLFKQSVNWLLGLTVVELRLIRYPVRLFSFANRASFDFEFFMYPSFCVLFNLHYPQNKSKLNKFMYYFYFCTFLTIIEVLIEKYTDILEYIHWTWYMSWLSFFITFYISHRYYRWFFKLNKH